MTSFGFNTGYIDNLTNGSELPFAVMPTCASGSWRCLPASSGSGKARALSQIRGVSTGPGQMALTVTPALATSTTSSSLTYTVCSSRPTTGSPVFSSMTWTVSGT